VTRRPSNRILLNLALDGLLALLALMLAVWAIAPRHWPSGAWWAVAAPGAVLALLAAGAVLRLPQQYWRFVGLRDLLAVAGAAFGGALLFWLGGQMLGGWQPANAAFPLIHLTSADKGTGIDALRAQIAGLI
jgi:O-antigen biosynthesis protein WbqV